MIEERPDDSMVDFGDIDEEPATSISEPPPRVVIEYRDRGIPWMLVPPLLALSAVIAAVAVYNVDATINSRRPRVAMIESPRTIVDERPNDSALLAGVTTNLAVLEPDLEPIPVENPPNPPKSVEAPRSALDPSLVIAAPERSALTAEMSPSEPASAPFPRVAALGFDPAAMATSPSPADPSVSAPVGRDLSPVAQPRRLNEPAQGLIPPAQPAEIDPDLLPPDPRKARIDRQRRVFEARRKTEAERFQFHADLSAIYKKLGRKSAPSIHELVQAYGMEVSPTALGQAKKALGPTGMYAGVDTSERINLLRKLGFPETAILSSIFDLESRHESKSARNAPTQDELYIRSASILLNHPPSRSIANARAVSSPGTASRGRPLSSDPAEMAPLETNR